MSPVELAERRNPAQVVGEQVNAPEFAEFVKVNKPELVNAFWGARTILGLTSIEDAKLHRANLVLPITRLNFPRPDGEQKFDVVEGPPVNDLILDDVALGELELTKRQRKDYKKFKNVIIDNSVSFWEIEGRGAEGYKAGRILAYQPTAMRAIESDFKDQIPEGVDVSAIALKASEAYLTKIRELTVPLEEPAKINEPEISEEVKKDVAFMDLLPVPVSTTTVGAQIAEKSHMRRKALVGTLSAGVVLSLVGLNETTEAVPAASIRRILPGHDSGNGANNSSALKVELKLGPDGKPIIAVVSPPPTETSQKAPADIKVQEQVKAPDAGKDIRVKEAGESIASAPYLIETVKSKKDVIAAKAVKHNIPAEFLALFAQLRSAGNSKAGDRADSDAKGLLLITDMLAQDEMKNIKGMTKYDLLKDEDNLEIGASRLKNLIIKYGGLETNDQIAGIAQEFIGVKTEVPAFLSAIWLQQKKGDYTTFNLWVSMNVAAINNARISQGLKT
jgi:hypothetical protein